MTLFDTKKERFEAEWATELPNAIRACIEFIRRAALEASHTKPDVIYSVAGALKIVSDIQMSKDVIDARLADFNRETREADQQMASEARQEYAADRTIIDSNPNGTQDAA